MKGKLLLSLLAAGAAAATALGVYAMDDREGGQPGGPGLETVSLEVQGMQSFMCEMGVNSALSSLSGVTAVSVDRKAARAEVTFDPAAVSPGAFVDAVNAVGYRASLPPRASTADARSATANPRPAHAASPSRLTADQIERVSVFIAGQIIETQEIPTGEAIEEATGVELSIADIPMLQQAVLGKLVDDPRGQELLAGSRCSDYGACSLWGNLAGASGETLGLYEREKALDGETYESMPLPAFEARNLAGETVRSAELVGRPAVLAFLAVHCNHSMETFPILQELHRRHAEDGLQVVGVLVNSGSVEDANGWVPHFAPEYPIWVYEDASLGDLVGSHLVPTYLLVDEHGNVRKKLVGFKDQEDIIADVALIRRADA